MILIGSVRQGILDDLFVQFNAGHGSYAPSDSNDISGFSHFNFFRFYSIISSNLKNS